MRTTEGLSPAQVAVVRVFFGLSASHGFLLAGGGAMIALGMSSRTTDDLDLFAGPPDTVTEASTQLERAALDHGWTVDFLRRSPTFARLRVSTTDVVYVDLAVDSRPEWPPALTFVGPSYAPEELAGRKLVAMFDRAEARDFVDVYLCAVRFGKDDLLQWAAQVDRGFDLGVLVVMMDSIARHDDPELALGGVAAPAVREFFRLWAAELRAGLARPDDKRN